MNRRLKASTSYSDPPLVVAVKLAGRVTPPAQYSVDAGALQS